MCRIPQLFNQVKTMIYSVFDESSVSKAVNLIRKNEVIAIPTDTVYGLCCNFRDLYSLRKICEIKGRSEEKPIAICVSNIDQISKWANIEHVPLNLISSLLPGPVTLILESSHELKKSFPIAKNEIGIRVPKHDFVLNFLKELQEPIALTSANVSNTSSTISITEFDVLFPYLSAVFDAGIISNNSLKLASTVIDLTVANEATILRAGHSCSYICNILKDFNIVVNL